MSDSPFDRAAGPPIRWGWIMASGLLSILIGLLAFAWPFPATLAVALVVGALLAASGVSAVVMAMGGGGHPTRWYDLGYGALSLLVGLLIIFRPLSGAVSLTMLVAIWLGVRGVLEIWWGWRLPNHRWGLIALGVLNILLDLFIFATLPLSGLTIPGYILGISFLSTGFTQIWIALALRDLVKAAGPA